MTSAREREALLLDRCAAAAQGIVDSAGDQREANVFRLAAMIVRPRFPRQAELLMQASDRYFAARPNERLSAQEILLHGWTPALPRMHDMLTARLASTRVP